MIDFSVYESGSGGDLILKGNDLSTTTSWYNMPYIALFGGNVAQLTPTERPDGEQQFDFWGNTLLFANTPEIQYNSRTEKILNETPLNSAGRVRIEQAVKKDLDFMTQFADIEVEVTLTGVDRVRIDLQVTELENETSTIFTYLWDGAKVEEITQQNVGNIQAPVVWLLSSGDWNDQGVWDDESNWED